VTTPTHIAILGALLAVASAADVAQRRVPNAVVLPIALAGIASRWLAGGPGSAAWGLAAGGIVFALLLVPWMAGKLGGGDAKLAAAVAVWIGPSGLGSLALATLLAAVPVALAVRARHRVELRRMARGLATPGQVKDVEVPRESVPLAVAIALGAFATLQGWGP
jgi:prepilin peptidase CpaA